MTRAMVREFAEREIIPQTRENDRLHRFPAGLLKQMAPLGLLGGPIPQEYGGMGTDYRTWGLVMEELGRACLSTATTVLVQVSLVGLNLLHWASEEQRRRYLPRLTSGEIIGAFGLTEPNVGSNPAGMETVATRRGDDWVLRGQKTWISNGGVADLVIVYAQTDPSQGHRGIAAFLVERGMDGFTSQNIEGKLGLHASNTATLFFDEVRIPAEQVMAPPGQGIHSALSTLETSRMTAASAFVGLAQACLEAAVEYAQTRQQFGRAIGSFQMVQDLIAEMVVEVEAARCLARRAAALKDQGKMTARDGAMAKYYASEVAVRCSERAIQVHGGHGYSDEFPVERYFRDARVGTLYEGTSQIQKLIIGRETLGISAFV
ncbi:MAG: acyl-CoA dehydrogenase family protein [Chloroflexi bacterium]|nr:acyl-CoA dehydrogenase family protein [Chloroflexota bacterium]